METMSTNTMRNLRPALHFTPEKGWQNDPNGLIYKDGTWHLYYQYNPNDAVWGPMHWGHAVSKDLYHWEELPVAIWPDDKEYIFSGSMVYDKNNTSGLGKINENGELIAPMIAAYTGHEIATDVERQCIAYSLDGGLSATPYEGNPVIDCFEENGKIQKDFRDPKIFWNVYTNHWNMVVAAFHCCHFYESDDLIHWNKTGDFHHDFEKITNCWACVDLIPFETEEGLLWVLLASMEDRPTDPEARTMYFVGRYENGTFTPIEKTAEPLWIDFGWDNYAGVSYNDAEEPVMVSWGINPRYANFVPSGDTNGYRGLMTSPRKLELMMTTEGYRVAYTPYHLDVIRKDTTEVSGQAIDQIPATFLLEVHGDEGTITLENEDGEKAIVSVTKDHVIFDRSQAGETEFHFQFDHASFTFEMDDFLVRKAHRIGSGDMNMTLFFDVSYIEAYVDGGLETGSMVVYPRKPYTKVTYSEGLSVKISTVE